jgi:hypothetical protein
MQVDSKWYVKTLWYMFRNENFWEVILKFYLVTECAKSVSMNGGNVIVLCSNLVKFMGLIYLEKMH